MQISANYYQLVISDKSSGGLELEAISQSSDSFIHNIIRFPYDIEQRRNTRESSNKVVVQMQKSRYGQKHPCLQDHGSSC